MANRQRANEKGCRISSQPWRSDCPSSPRCFISSDCVRAITLQYHLNILTVNSTTVAIRKYTICTDQALLLDRRLPPFFSRYLLLHLVRGRAPRSSRSAKAQGRPAVFLRSLALPRPATRQHLPDYLSQHLVSGQICVSPARHEVIHANYSRITKISLRV